MQKLHSLAASASCCGCPAAADARQGTARSISSSAAAAHAQASTPQLQQPQPQSPHKHQQHQQPPQSPPPQLDPAVLQLAQQYQRSRLLDFYNNHLSRELMLKLPVRSLQRLPRVRSVDLGISAKDLLGKRYVEKWEMLLPALALEYVSGQPATFLYSSVKYYRSRNAVTGVKVRLTGSAALDLLQKLTHIVLPSQNGFAGVDSRSFDAAGNLHFRVPRMVNFPDFEEQFEIFENLGALHVSINLANCSRQHAQRSALLLTGLQLPILDRKKLREAAAAAAAEAAAKEAEEGSGSSGSDGESSEDEE